MNKISIRAARLDDIPVLLEFEQGVISAERPFDPTLDEDPLRYYDLPGLIESADAELLIAEADGSAIGCGYAKKKEALPFLDHNYYAYLGFMYTVPAWRGKGVNQQILLELVGWAEKNDLFEIRLEVYKHNTAAIRAYEKAGMAQHMIEMRMASGLKKK